MPGPRPIRFTAQELTVIEMAMQLYVPRSEQGLSSSPVGRVYAKIDAATAPAPKGAAVAPLEAALERSCPGKVARLLPSGYGRASRRAAQLGATPEDVAIVGRWLHRWWTRGTVTLLDVLNRWDTWLPKARAEAAPQGLPEGLDGASDVGQGTGSRGPATPQGRRAPGQW